MGVCTRTRAQRRAAALSGSASSTSPPESLPPAPTSPCPVRCSSLHTPHTHTHTQKRLLLHARAPLMSSPSVPPLTLVVAYKAVEGHEVHLECHLPGADQVRDASRPVPVVIWLHGGGESPPGPPPPHEFDAAASALARLTVSPSLCPPRCALRSRCTRAPSTVSSLLRRRPLRLLPRQPPLDPRARVGLRLARLPPRTAGHAR